MIWNPLLWPRWAQGAGLVGVGVIAFLIWLAIHDKGVIARHEEKITNQVEAVSSEAAASASAAVDHHRNVTEIGNAQARDAAAASSDDPLGDGLRSLRRTREDKSSSR